MQDCTPEETDAFLKHSRKRCEGCGRWQHWALQQGTVTTTAGVVDRDGISTGLYVELMFRRSSKTKLLHYKFTVFHSTRWGPERVYQLDITQTEKPMKSWHEFPHEHWGSARIVGDATWSNWSYDEILAHFSSRTAIDFDPCPPHPEHFALEG